MRKLLFFTPLAFALAFALSAAEVSKLDALKNDRAETVAKLAGLRAKYIESEPELKKTHERIMRLQRDLAVALDAHKDVRALHDRLTVLDNQIAELEKQLPAAQPAPEVKK